MKQCGRCKKTLSLDSFSFKNKEKGWYSSYCKECNKAKNKEHYQENKATYREKAAAYKKVHGTRMRGLKYGLSEQETVELLSANDGMCAICLSEPAQHIDHCHESGRVRGALCKACNNGLGFFRDNTQALERAIKYLNGPLE